MWRKVLVIALCAACNQAGEGPSPDGPAKGGATPDAAAPGGPDARTAVFADARELFPDAAARPDAPIVIPHPDAGTAGGGGTADAGTAGGGGTADAGTTGGGGTADAGTTGGGPVLASCVGDPFTPSPAGDWNHLSSAVIAALGDPAHSADDVLTSDTAAVGGARFEYGLTLKDLEDEDVRVYLDDCSGWRLDGVERTDGEGRVAHVFPELPYGVYDVRYEVVGDASVVPAQLWILPAGTHLVVYDIDGTLTTSDLEEIKQLLWDLFDGTYVPAAYPSAAAMTRAWDGIGEIGVYMTGRPHWLGGMTRAWLADLGFAPGPLFLAQTTNDVLPTDSGVGDFKLQHLDDWKAAGFLLDDAHGNATTDIYAYLGAGIAATSTWIIGSNAGQQGTNPVHDSWADHTAAIEKLPPVAQPFHR